jgi:hypothetical protein
MLADKRLLIAALVLGAFLAPADAASASSHTFNLRLRASDAIPHGDHNDSANAAVTINPGKHTICWTFSSYGGIGSPKRAKIGKAPRRKNGPIVVTLSNPFVPRGCTTVAVQTLTPILAHPTAYYIIITNPLHPNGSARAQL